MNNSENKNSLNELESFLNTELEKSERNTKLIWYAGGGLALFLLCYMSWIYSAVKNDLLNPQSVAQVAAAVVDENIPNYLKSAEKGMHDYAPEFAEVVVKEVKSAIPALGREVEAHIDDAYKVIPELSKEITDGVKGYIMLNEADIKEFFTAHNESEFAQHMVDVLFQDVESHLNNSLPLFTGDKNLADVHASSLQSIRSLNLQLKDLVKKHPNRLSRTERQQARLIATLYNSLNKEPG